MWIWGDELRYLLRDSFQKNWRCRHCGPANPAIIPIKSITWHAGEHLRKKHGILPYLLKTFADRVFSCPFPVATSGATVARLPPSSQIPTVSTFGRLINDLRQELSLLAGGIQTVLVGHSMGCRIVLEAFSQQPSNVTGTVLLDGSWYGSAPTRDYKPTTSSPAERVACRNGRV